MADLALNIFFIDFFGDMVNNLHQSNSAMSVLKEDVEDLKDGQENIKQEVDSDNVWALCFFQENWKANTAQDDICNNKESTKSLEAGYKLFFSSVKLSVEHTTIFTDTNE